ncbi:Gibberellin 2-beta-dioxygenase 8 [Linum perenne]
MRREQVKVFKQPFDKKKEEESSSTIEQFATTVADLAQKLAQILAERVGRKSSFFKENCLASSCYLRMNRYPPCPMPTEVFGLMPHTDSDFLTILHQDQVGGLQLVRDGKWFAVKPNPRALIINIGDLFQVKHKITAFEIKDFTFWILGLSCVIKSVGIINRIGC